MLAAISMSLAACCLGQSLQPPDWGKLLGPIGRQTSVETVEWEPVCPTPQGRCPQGLDTCGGKLYLSAHPTETGSGIEALLSGSRSDSRSDSRAAVYELDDAHKSFRKLFDLPPDATHTSGLVFARDDRLFAVDYHSNKIYLIDFEASKKQGKVSVLVEVSSGLKGTSACCIAEFPRVGTRLLVTDFMHSSRNECFEFDLARNTITKDAGYTYRNYGFSQGAKLYKGLVYESGNRPLRLDYIVQHRLEDSLKARQLQPIREWNGPGRGIEDIAFLDDYAYVTDEKTNLLYRAKLVSKRDVSNNRN